MSDQFRFTQKRIRDLAPPAEGRAEYVDTDQPKLRVRVTSSGHKSFAVLTKDRAGEARRITLGSWPTMSVETAREEAGKVLGKILNGIDPVAEKRKVRAESMTLGELLSRYLDGRDLKPKTKIDYTIKLKMGFPDWLTMPASKITEAMILRRHRELTDKFANDSTNGIFRSLRLVIRFGVAIGAIESSPVAILSNARLWHRSHRKDRVIPSDKLGVFLRGVRSMPNIQDQAMLQIMLFSGLRLSEVLGLRWDDVDLTRRILTVRDTKNHTNHSMPIAEPLVPVLIELNDQTGDTPLVFTTTGKQRSYPKKTIMRAIKITGVEFGPHDCRRTFATISEAVGCPTTLTKRLLNHITDRDVTGGYIKTEMDTLRQAVSKIAAYIEAKAQGGVVVPFQARKSA